MGTIIIVAMDYKVLIPRWEIEKAVRRLAAEINKEYAGKRPLLIGILKGSFVFLADLIRQLDMPLEVDFVRLSSYGCNKESSGEICMVEGLCPDVKGRDVLVIEDIIDTGLTINYLLDYLKKQEVASVKLCALADKPSRRKTPVEIDYLGFEVPNKFIVGYGIDYNEQFRHLPDICFVEGE